MESERLHLIEKDTVGARAERVAFKWTWLEWETNGRAQVHTVGVGRTQRKRGQGWAEWERSNGYEWDGR